MRSSSSARRRRTHSLAATTLYHYRRRPTTLARTCAAGTQSSGRSRPGCSSLSLAALERRVRASQLWPPKCVWTRRDQLAACLSLARLGPGANADHFPLRRTMLVCLRLSASRRASLGAGRAKPAAAAAAQESMPRLISGTQLAESSRWVAAQAANHSSPATAA